MDAETLNARAECSNWKRNLVNLWQTADHRREKYHLCRSFGIRVPHAKRMRDWRLAKIERFFGLEIKSLPYQGTLPLHLNSVMEVVPE